jgi:hypothetical protein
MAPLGERAQNNAVCHFILNNASWQASSTFSCHSMNHNLVLPCVSIPEKFNRLAQVIKPTNMKWTLQLVKNTQVWNAEQQNSIAECSALVAACTTDKMRKCNQSHKVYLSRVHLLPFYNLFSACLHAFP